MALITDYLVDITTGLATAHVAVPSGQTYVLNAFIRDGAVTEQAFQACISGMESFPEGFLYFANGQVFVRDERPSYGDTWDWQALSWIHNEQRASEIVATARSDALQGVDDAAGKARLRYITSIPGQSETYQRKEQQARAWAAAEFAGQAPSFIAAEAEALNISAESVAIEVMQLADYWANVKGPQIEATRRKWKVAIEAAGTDLDAIASALNQGQVALEAL